MAVISEVNALCNLVVKATNFVSYLHDGWYKGLAELDAFPAKVSMLSAKQAQWTSLLHKFGMSEDEHLKPLVTAATQILEEEEEYVRKMKRSRFFRFKRRVFPGHLTYIFAEILTIVDAGPQLLAARVDTHSLLEKTSAQTPALLSFVPDRKYVPPLGSITKLQEALQDTDGQRVVTLYGGPGTGKSSLSKYIALQYQTRQKEQMEENSGGIVHFPDGVFYLFCGKGASDKVTQLQLELLENLGLSTDSEPEPNVSTAIQSEGGEHWHLQHSNQKKLRFCLAKKKLLIILDDIWERQAVEQLLVSVAQGVKYLVTSQIRGIWADATKIELVKPTMKEARQIMANYTEGLPTKGKFPLCIQSVTDDIIKKLEHHPLSLANIGLTIDRSRAVDPDEWRVVKKNLSYYLDENDLHDSPVVYERTYPLTVGASMMLMVDSLPPAAHRLLLLVGLLKDEEIPEPLLKFFVKFIEFNESKSNLYSYMKYLQDRSLLESRQRGDKFVLAAHNLRKHYILEKNTAEVSSIATKILCGRRSHEGQLTQTGDTDKTLVAIMGAMYFAEAFQEVVATSLQNQMEIVNNIGIIPRSMRSSVNALDLIKRTQDQRHQRKLKHGIEGLVCLLNPDGEASWMQEAHEYARKIIIMFICRGELDDGSMARLLQMPQTSATAFKTLELICEVLRWSKPFCDLRKTFGSVHVETMKVLLDLLHNDAAKTSRRAAAIVVLGLILGYETKDKSAILSTAKKWVELLAKNSGPILQVAVAQVLQSLKRRPSSGLILDFPGVLPGLLALLSGDSKDIRVQESAARSIYFLSFDESAAVKIACTPGALKTLFHAFLLKEVYSGRVGGALEKLSTVKENRIRFTGVQDCLKDLSELLANSEAIEWECQHIKSPFVKYIEGTRWQYNCDLACKILGNLALAKELREVITLLPNVKETLQSLQLRGQGGYECKSFCYSLSKAAARALTILDPMRADSTLTTAPPPPPWACYRVYKGRAEAFKDMGMYLEVLEAVQMAYVILREILSEDGNLWTTFYDHRSPGIVSERPSWIELQNLRNQEIFLQAMLKEYAGAITSANSALEECYDDKYWERLQLDCSFRMFSIRHYDDIENGKAQKHRECYLLGERGVVLRLSGALNEALVDLDRAVQLAEPWDYDRLKQMAEPRDYDILKQRGFVKHLMGDNEGARADAESAKRSNGPRRILTGTQSDQIQQYEHSSLVQQRVNYLGFSL